MKSNSYVQKDLVIIGGGHAHIQVIKKFAMRPISGVRLTLISDRSFAPYSGMLPGHLAGWYSFDDIHFDLRRICQRAGAIFIPDTVTGIDTRSREIQLAHRPPINYDLSSINIGSTPSLDRQQSLPNLLPLKPISHFLEGWNRFLTGIKNFKVPQRIAIVGAGAAGVEVSMMVQKRIREMNSKSEVHLYSNEINVLKEHNSRAKEFISRELKSQGIVFHPNQAVKSFDGRFLAFSNNNKEPADFVFWATQASPPQWFKTSGLNVSDQGFLKVDSYLRVKNHEALFAAGDCVSLDNYDLPKSGVYAVRQGPVLAENLRQYFLETHCYQKFRPQRNALALITLGDKNVVASRGRFFAHGHALWKLKDHIDRKFMRRFQETPLMENVKSDVLPNRKKAAKNICGGCGSKINAITLSQVMKRLPQVNDDSVLIGLKNPDDAAVILPKPEYLRVETVDYFRSFTSDSYLLGQVAAAHSLGDIFAMGGKPHTAMATVTIPASHKVSQDLFQLMSGALSIFKEENVTLVGGHTVEAAELGLGFSISGYVKPNRIWKKTGARADDVLLLTKPIGSGLILAGHMQGLARGQWVEKMFEQILLSHRFAWDVLQDFKVNAATDVTGFGLLGHLKEMLGPGSLPVIWKLENLPIMDGFYELYHQGIRSSLSSANRDNVLDMSVGIPDQLLEAMIDPQTGGGLLLALPRSEASACVDALKSVGYLYCSEIGTVTGGLENVTRRGQSAEL